MTPLNKTAVAFLIATAIIITAFGFPSSAHSDFEPYTSIGTSFSKLFAMGQIEAIQEASTTPQKPARDLSVQIGYKHPSALQVELYELSERYFGDVPEMLLVIRCESHFRQFRSEGVHLISPTNDVGIAQINIPTWAEKAKELGFDIFNSSEDNLKMARFIYETEGIESWTCAE